VPRGKGGRVTLRDVADRAGVSVTTVSFVLSGRHDMRISAATEERVTQAARTLGYRRRLVPSTPPPSGGPVIGLISDVIATESFGGEMVRGCVAAATERGHVVLMADSEGTDELEESAVRALLARGVGKFLYATMATIAYRVPEVLRDQRLVLMNTLDPTLEVPAVIPDDHKAGRTAARTLIAAGHDSGIWLAGESRRGSSVSGKRLAGVKAGLRAAGLRPAGQVRCGWWPDEARRAMTALFDAGWWEQERPTAVIAMNDRTAMGVYQAAAAAGRSIPGDLSVISFDNSDLARWLVPGLSSMDLPYFDIGRRATELLLAADTEPRVHKIAMPLRARESIGPPVTAGRTVAEVNASSAR